MLNKEMDTSPASIISRQIFIFMIKKQCPKCNRLITANNFNLHFNSDHSISQKKHIRIDSYQKNGRYLCPYCEMEFTKNGLGTHIWRKHLGQKVNNRVVNNGHFKKGLVPWNNGLTKQTDSRIKSTIHTVKTKEKLSSWRSKILEEKGSGGFKDIKWYKIQNCLCQEFIVRGTWELNTAIFLNDNKILWIRKIYLKYRDSTGLSRIYCPDFYLPEYDLYLEIKGYFSKKDKEKLQYVKYQNNINLQILQKVDLQELKII